MAGEKCTLCGTTFKDREAFQKHLNEKEHVFCLNLQKASKITKQSKLLFTINESPNLSNIILRKNEPKSLTLEVKTTSPKPVTILTAQTDPKISEILLKPVCPCKFTCESAVFWEIFADCKNDGLVFFPILVKTENEGKVQNYVLELVFHTHDEFFDDLHARQPFQQAPKKVLDNFVENIIDDDPHKFWKSKDKVVMKLYPLPSEVLLFFNNNLKPFEGITKQQKAQLGYIKGLIDTENPRKSLTVRKNYSKLLEILLYSEEHQMLRNIRNYDQSQQKLVKVGNLLELQVPDLSEGRPSILVGDTIRVKNGKQYQNGVVCIVNESSVLLKFPKRFMQVFSRDTKYHVSFTFNRYCLRAQHQAVDFTRTDNIEHFFFEKTILKTSLYFNLSWFNKDIANNAEQQQAVCAILHKSAMPAPYLIFGPPGTGKTMTVAEAVKQIYKLTNQKVLICTPSNNAANELLRRLVDTVPTEDLFRLVASSFSEYMPEDLVKYCNYHRGVFYQPVMQELMNFRIVVTTLISAARLVNKGCPEGHFSFVFVDEAGQATESETLVAIARILSGRSKPGRISGQVVLAGDPRQLGPVIQSAFAKNCGFDVSMLERLIDTCKQYQKNGGKTNPAALTKLLKNYRSHRVILQQPNNLFYENELQVSGDDLINAAVGWEVLPNKSFPMVFHSVVGIDQREKSSPSFFNIQEIQVVMDYLEKLIGCTMNGLRVNEGHIAVISPYKKQVEKFKQAFNKKHYSNLFVGSVEQIQGQERMIVLISTVRSKPQLLSFDAKFHLGFLTNPKRFNVAITRAKALLIIVGNPNVLQMDQYWKSLILYCKDNGALIGDKFVFAEEEPLSNVTSSSGFNETDSGEGTSLSGTD